MTWSRGETRWAAPGTALCLALSLVACNRTASSTGAAPGTGSADVVAPPAPLPPVPTVPPVELPPVPAALPPVPGDPPVASPPAPPVSSMPVGFELVGRALLQPVARARRTTRETGGSARI